jgi:transcriptional regulator with XRE-family HTH domain
MAAEIYAQIGAAIRKRRDALGLSQAQLADRVGLVRTSITMIENGSQALLVHQLVDIAKALKAAPGELLAEAGPREEVGPSRALYQTSLMEGLLAGLDRPVKRITK